MDESSLLPEIDNLYLDLNGIIHTATHGNDGVSKRLKEKDVILIMMAYIDREPRVGGAHHRAPASRSPLTRASPARPFLLPQRW